MSILTIMSFCNFHSQILHTHVGKSLWPEIFFPMSGKILMKTYPGATESIFVIHYKCSL